MGTREASIAPAASFMTAHSEENQSRLSSIWATGQVTQKGAFRKAVTTWPLSPFEAALIISAWFGCGLFPLLTTCRRNRSLPRDRLKGAGGE